MTHPGTALRISATIMLMTSTALFAQAAEEDMLIEAQALGPALQALAEEYDLQLLYESALVANLSAQAIPRGASSETALNELLEGTNLAYQFVNERTVTIQEKESLKEQEPGKSRPASKQTLIAQAGTPAKTKTGRAPKNLSGGEEQENSSLIEEVVVTSRRREENLQDVPISVSVFSAADLEARSFTNLREVGEFTPNFAFAEHETLGRRGSVVMIRGVGQTDPSGFNDPGVGIYVDGVYMGRMQGLDYDLMEIERIEVLRGPQGTLFGKNTIGGAVNMVTVRPTDEFRGIARVITGRYNRRDAKVSINIPIVPGKWAARFAGATRNRDGYGTRLDWYTGKKIDEMADENRQSGRAYFDWTPNENVDVLFSIDATRAREKGSAYKLVKTIQSPLVKLLNQFVDPPYNDATFFTDSNFTNYSSGGNRADLDAWGTSLTVDWRFGDQSLKSITSYRKTKSELEIDADGSFYFLHDTYWSVDQDQFSQEFQFSGVSFDDRLNWVAGALYFEENGLQGSVLLLFPELKDPIGLDISLDAPVWFSTKSYAGFGQGTFDLTDKLSMTAGLRYTYEEKEIARQRTNLAGEVTIPLSSRNGNWDAVTGRAGLEYRWNEKVMGYVSAARGFKSGGLNARARSEKDFLPYDPEYIWTYEAGLKSDLLDARLRLNGTVFYSDYTDLQFRIFVPDPETGDPLMIVGNQASARVQGFELDAVAAPAPGLTLTAGIGYTDAKYLKVTPASGVSLDDKFPKTPKWTVALSGQYATPIKDWGELIGRLDYVHKTRIEHRTVNDPLNSQAPYGLLNARLTFDTSGSWSISAFITNLTDKNYLAAGQTIGALGYSRVQYAAPRQWGLSLDYRF